MRSTDGQRRRRHDDDDRPRGGILKKIIYVIAAAAIAACWVYAFRAYFEHYDSTHPEITWALPLMQDDIVRAEGVLLWDEVVLRAPVNGKLSYPLGAEPSKVRAGSVVARVASGGKRYDVKASESGYFIHGLDGVEGAWKYKDLWLGGGDLPDPGVTLLTSDGSNTSKGAAIGKLIPQPQELRFIGYAEHTQELEARLKSRTINVKMDALDTPSAAAVRVYERYGDRLKIYLTMPWFPPSMLKSRRYSLMIESGRLHGVTVPNSSVIERDGGRGVFVIKGSNAAFVAVEGRYIDEGRYLITSGITLGDAVIVNAETAREGRVDLW